MASSEQKYSVTELRRMDEQTARSELTVDQFERWEGIQELHEEAEQTRDQWEDEQETVVDLTVNADIEQLGTRLDLFGNDVLVRVDPEDREFRQVAQSLDERFGDHDPEDIEDIDDDQRADIAEGLLDMLDCVLREWDGHRWSDISEHDRETVLQQCRSEWGVDGLLLAWLDIAAAVNEDRRDKLDVIESFR